MIAETGADLVYTNTVTCAEGAIAAWRARKPHVWHIHEHILRNVELAPLLPERVYSAIVYSLSRTVVFCSRSLARGYPRLAGKASIVHNGLPFRSNIDRPDARRNLVVANGLDPGAKLVAVVGTLQPIKDHFTFLAAAERVARKVGEAVFLIVGGGTEQYTGILKERAKELRLETRVRFLGWRDDVPELLAAVDVLVISSAMESFGLTAIEALSVGTPVVATRCGGPEEVVRDGATGLLVPVKDPDAMADAILRILRDPELAKRLGAQGKVQATSDFGIDRYIREIQRVIQGAASSR